ncbi:MAG: DDE-type integrase/transposase/recombinase [Chloroflexi bacterium]|nr:DDE-type integrase/transposase/recombinase [Chloroflexota bacterium]
MDRQSIARLRFAIIGPLLASPPPRGRLQAAIQVLSEQDWTMPDGRTRRFSAATIERWYYAAKKADTDPMPALRRRRRSDAGQRRSVSDALLSTVQEQYAIWPWWSVELHHRNLVALAAGHPDIGPVPSPSTLRRLMREHSLVRRSRSNTGKPRDFLSYEVPYANSLWHADVHHSSVVRVATRSGEMVTPKLLAFIDDHARVLAHAQWYLGETAHVFVHGLTQAFYRMGLPRALMTDNGAAMIAGEVINGLDALGVIAATTVPRTPEQNAKIERMWATMEGGLLAMFDPDTPLDLTTLNTALHAWIGPGYHAVCHRELGTTPMQRFRDSHNRGRDCPSAERLRFVFQIPIERKPRRTDGTVTIDGVRFQLPAPWRTRTRVHLRYARWDLSRADLVDPDDPDRSLALIRPLDKTANANAGRRAQPRQPAVHQGPRPPAPFLEQLLARHHESGGIAPFLPFPDDEET